MFSTTLNAHLYTVPSAPTWLAAAVALLVLLPFLGSLGVALRATKRRRAWVPIAGGLALGAFAALLLWIGPLVALFSMLPKDLACAPHTPCFPPLFLFSELLPSMVLSGLWVSLVGAGTCALGLVPDEEGSRRWLAAIAPGSLALLCLGLAPLIAQILYLGSLPGIPALVIDAPAFVQVGRSFDLQVALEPAPPGAPALSPLHIEASTLGPLQAHAGTSLRGLQIERELSMQVVAEQAHPSFPLRVGNQWIYRPSQTSHVHDSEPLETLPDGWASLTITAVEESPEARWFLVERRGPDTTVFKVAAVDGELRTDENERFLAAEPDQPSGACDFLALAPKSQCTCVPAAEIPGPVRCRARSTRKSGGLLDLAREVVTLGTASTALDRRSSPLPMQLVHFEPGPESAASARPLQQ